MNTLSIHTERAAIEIISRPARLSIEHRTPTFRVRSIKPEMHIERKKATFDVQWDVVNQTSGRPSAVQLIQQFALESKQQTLENIGAIVERGDTLKNVNDPDAFTKVAVSLSVRGMPELNIGLMPKERARIEWDPGSCVIEWSSPVLQIEWDKEFAPVIEWEPYAVEVRLRNRPLVQIRVNMKNMPGSLGIKVDHKV